MTIVVIVLMSYVCKPASFFFFWGWGGGGLGGAGVDLRYCYRHFLFYSSKQMTIEPGPPPPLNYRIIIFLLN